MRRLSGAFTPLLFLVLLLQQLQDALLHLVGGVVSGEVFAELANLDADTVLLVGLLLTHAPVRGHLLYCWAARPAAMFQVMPREGASQRTTERREQQCGCFKSCPREGASAKLYKKADPYCIVHR